MWGTCLSKSLKKLSVSYFLYTVKSQVVTLSQIQQLSKNLLKLKLFRLSRGFAFIGFETES